jgi:peroxin-5
VSCFLNALQSDPNNLDTLLALGISCTNILDEVQAMNYLKKWLMRNPKYQSLNFDPQIVPDEQSIYDFTMDQIKEMNHQMLHIY